MRRYGAAPAPSRFLLAQLQFSNYRAVTLDIGFHKVVEQVAPVSDHLEHTAAGMVVVLMRLEMLGKIVDALGEHRYLDFRRTGVVLVDGVALDDLLLFVFFHDFHPIDLFALRRAVGLVKAPDDGIIPIARVG